MRRFALAATIFLGPVTTGCGILGSCDADPITFELVPSDPDNFIDQSYFDALVDDPEWDCQFEADIRNAFGTKIGERWTCTAC